MFSSHTFLERGKLFSSVLHLLVSCILLSLSWFQLVLIKHLHQHFSIYFLGQAYLLGFVSHLFWFKRSAIQALLKTSRNSEATNSFDNFFGKLITSSCFCLFVSVCLTSLISRFPFVWLQLHSFSLCPWDHGGFLLSLIFLCNALSLRVQVCF